jgi:cholecystokinin A receptor/hypocretin (orexin) receptor 2
MALNLAVPAAVLFGIKREPIYGTLCGFDCSIDEQYKDSTFRKLYYIILGLVFLMTFTLLSTLYFLIWFAIKRRKGLENLSERLDNFDFVDEFEIVLRNSLWLFIVEDESSSLTLDNILLLFFWFPIFIAVTVAFVVSYLPSVGVLIIKSVNKTIATESSAFVQVLLKLLSRCHYLNNAINPIIYSFLNKHFRIEYTKLTQSIKICTQNVFTFLKFNIHVIMFICKTNVC